MKRLLSCIVVICILICSGCSSNIVESTQNATELVSDKEVYTEPFEEINSKPEYVNLNDEGLRDYMESTVYSQVIDQLDSEEYIVNNVSVQYISKEYLEELEYNSKENIYFGYTLSELVKQFDGNRYVFYYDDKNDKTDVKEFEKYDDTYDKVIKNVAIGTGVILVCVTISAVTGGAAPAVSIVFATSAKTGTAMALSSSVISGATAAITKGIETGDIEEVKKAALLEGSDGFKWGAISGAIAGGIKGGSDVSALKGADVTANGLTLKQAYKIQKESKYPLDVIKQMHSIDEYNVYKKAGLKAVMVNGKTALLPDIPLDYKSELADGTVVTNLERMQQGLAPIDPVSKKAYQLHHIGQKSDATLAVLNECQHQGNAAILNYIGKNSEIDRPGFAIIRKKFWEDCGSRVFNGGK